ncbi:MAG: hypothetical protein ACR2PS_18495 [Pseudomonadales bacterium]
MKHHKPGVGVKTGRDDFPALFPIRKRILGTEHHDKTHIYSPRIVNYDPEFMMTQKTLRKPENERETVYVDRVCLRCRESFVAEGKYNRLCDRCNRRNESLGVDAEGVMGL